MSHVTVSVFVFLYNVTMKSDHYWILHTIFAILVLKSSVGPGNE